MNELTIHGQAAIRNLARRYRETYFSEADLSRQQATYDSMLPVYLFQGEGRLDLSLPRTSFSVSIMTCRLKRDTFVALF